MLDEAAVSFVALGDTAPLHTYPLERITAVTAFADRPPRLMLEVDGEKKPVVYGVLPHRRAPNWTRDASARDDAVAAIAAALR